MNKVMDAVTREVGQIHLPPGYITEFGGQSKMYGEMVGGFLIAFVLSIIFMYMVLAAQFESFTHPITIMLSLPLAVPFALVSLFFFREHVDAVLDARHPAAVRHREKEFDPAARSDDQPRFARAWRGARRSCRPIAIGCVRS